MQAAVLVLHAPEDGLFFLKRGKLICSSGVQYSNAIQVSRKKRLKCLRRLRGL